MSTSADTTPVKPRRKRPKQPYRPNQSVLSVYVGPQVRDEIRRYAAENETTVSDVIRKGVGLVLLGTAGGEPAAVGIAPDAALEGGDPLSQHAPVNPDDDTKEVSNDP